MPIPFLAPVLGYFGFSSIGPVAGSIAAGAQSVFWGGAVPAGGLFAGAQSATMGGGAVAAAAAAAGAEGVAEGVAGAAAGAGPVAAGMAAAIVRFRFGSCRWRGIS